MQINSAGPLEPRKQVDVEAARKVVSEFEKVSSEVMGFDNADRIDLNGSNGVVELHESKLGRPKGMLYTGKIEFDPETKEKKDYSITVNYEKYGGAGINYSYHVLDDSKVSFWKDDMYQEAPLSRYIQEVVMDRKTGEIISYEARDERDEYLIPPGPGSDYFDR